MSSKGNTTRFAIFLLLAGILFGAGYLTAENLTPPGLVHFPVKDALAGENIFLEAKIEDRPVQQIQYVRIYFRTKGQSDYRYIDMDEQFEAYTGSIPGLAVQSPGVEYFILALFNDRTMATSPASNPFYAPYQVAITPALLDRIPAASEKPATERKLSTAGGVDVEAKILSPEPNEKVAEDEVVIAVSFLGSTDKLDLKSIKVFIDGKNFTSSAEISENVITCVPKQVTKGLHQVKVQLADKSGNRFPDIEWQFSISGDRNESFATERNLPFTGKVYAEFRNEKFADTSYAVTNVGGNISGKFGPLKYNGRVFFTSRENPDFQPRNRMFIEVGTSWIGVKFGDTNPTFNELMLWGRRVRGIEAYIKLGIINVEFVTGQINRKVEGIRYIAHPTEQPPYYIHPLTGQTITSTTGIYQAGTFEQTLMAIRPSFGGGRNFQLGLNLIKVKDDPKSIDNGTKPKDNIVFGPDFLLAFDNHRIELKASAAFSLLADDISTGAASKEDIENLVGDLELPFDPAEFEQYFVLNTSLTPIDPTGLTSLAYQGSFKFNYFNNNINVIYKSIGSAYNALANNFIRKDIQGFSVYDQIRLYRNQVYLNIGFEKFLEDISAEDDGLDSTAPNDYHSLNIGVSWFPQGSRLPRISVNWKNYERNNGLDTLDYANAVNYQNTDLSFQVGYDIQLFDMNHSLNVSHIANNRADGFDRTIADFENSIQMFSLRTKYQIPLTTVVSYAKNDNNASGGNYNFNYNMLSLSGAYRMLNDKLNLTAGYSSTSASGSNLTSVDNLGNPLPQPEMTPYSEYSKSAFSIGGSYAVMRRHLILWDMSFVNYNDKLADKSYSNNYFRIRYQMQY